MILREHFTENLARLQTDLVTLGYQVYLSIARWFTVILSEN
jgi:hypothetical protein